MFGVNNPNSTKPNPNVDLPLPISNYINQQSQLIEMLLEQNRLLHGKLALCEHQLHSLDHLYQSAPLLMNKHDDIVHSGIHGDSEQLQHTIDTSCALLHDDYTNNPNIDNKIIPYSSKTRDITIPSHPIDKNGHDNSTNTKSSSSIVADNTFNTRKQSQNVSYITVLNPLPPYFRTPQNGNTTDRYGNHHNIMGIGGIHTNHVLSLSPQPQLLTYTKQSLVKTHPSTSLPLLQQEMYKTSRSQTGIMPSRHTLSLSSHIKQRPSMSTSITPLDLGYNNTNNNSNNTSSCTNNSTDNNDDSYGIYNNDIPNTPGNLTQHQDSRHHNTQRQYSLPLSTDALLIDTTAYNTVQSTLRSKTLIYSCDLYVTSKIKSSLVGMIYGIIYALSPNRHSEMHRANIRHYIKHIVRRTLGSQVYFYGDSALRTYTAMDPVRLSIFVSKTHESSWIRRVVSTLSQELNHTEGSGNNNNNNNDTTTSSSSTNKVSRDNNNNNNNNNDDNNTTTNASSGRITVLNKCDSMTSLPHYNNNNNNNNNTSSSSYISVASHAVSNNNNNNNNGTNSGNGAGNSAKDQCNTTKEPTPRYHIHHVSIKFNSQQLSSSAKSSSPIPLSTHPTTNTSIASQPLQQPSSEQPSADTSTTPSPSSPTSPLSPHHRPHHDSNSTSMLPNATIITSQNTTTTLNPSTSSSSSMVPPPSTVLTPSSSAMLYTNTPTNYTNTPTNNTSSSSSASSTGLNSPLLPPLSPPSPYLSLCVDGTAVTIAGNRVSALCVAALCETIDQLLLPSHSLKHLILLSSMWALSNRILGHETGDPVGCLCTRTDTCRHLIPYQSSTNHSTCSSSSTSHCGTNHSTNNNNNNTTAADLCDSYDYPSSSYDQQPQSPSHTTQQQQQQQSSAPATTPAATSLNKPFSPPRFCPCSIGLSPLDGGIPPAALRTICIFIINAYHHDISTPLDSFLKFIEYVAYFDWANWVLTIYGPICKQCLYYDTIVPILGQHCSWPRGRTPLITQQHIQPFLVYPSNINAFGSTITQYTTEVHHTSCQYTAFNHFSTNRPAFCPLIGNADLYSAQSTVTSPSSPQSSSLSSLYPGSPSYHQSLFGNDGMHTIQDGIYTPGFIRHSLESSLIPLSLPPVCVIDPCDSTVNLCQHLNQQSLLRMTSTFSSSYNAIIHVISTIFSQVEPSAPSSFVCRYNKYDISMRATVNTNDDEDSDNDDNDDDDDIMSLSSSKFSQLFKECNTPQTDSTTTNTTATYSNTNSIVGTTDQDNEVGDSDGTAATRKIDNTNNNNTTAPTTTTTTTNNNTNNNNDTLSSTQSSSSSYHTNDTYSKSRGGHGVAPTYAGTHASWSSYSRSASLSIITSAIMTSLFPPALISHIYMHNLDTLTSQSSHTINHISNDGVLTIVSFEQHGQLRIANRLYYYHRDTNTLTPIHHTVVSSLSLPDQNTTDTNGLSTETATGTGMTVASPSSSSSSVLNKYDLSTMTSGNTTTTTTNDTSSIRTGYTRASTMHGGGSSLYRDDVSITTTPTGKTIRIQGTSSHLSGSIGTKMVLGSPLSCTPHPPVVTNKKTNYKQQQQQQQYGASSSYYPNNTNPTATTTTTAFGSPQIPAPSASSSSSTTTSRLGPGGGQALSVTSGSSRLKATAPVFDPSNLSSAGSGRGGFPPAPLLPHSNSSQTSLLSAALSSGSGKPLQPVQSYHNPSGGLPPPPPSSLPSVMSPNTPLGGSFNPLLAAMTHDDRHNNTTNSNGLLAARTYDAQHSSSLLHHNHDTNNTNMFSLPVHHENNNTSSSLHTMLPSSMNHIPQTANNNNTTTTTNTTDDIFAPINDDDNAISPSTPRLNPVGGDHDNTPTKDKTNQYSLAGLPSQQSLPSSQPSSQPQSQPQPDAANQETNVDLMCSRLQSAHMSQDDTPIAGLTQEEMTSMLLLQRPSVPVVALNNTHFHSSFHQTPLITLPGASSSSLLENGIDSSSSLEALAPGSTVQNTNIDYQSMSSFAPASQYNLGDLTSQQQQQPSSSSPLDDPNSSNNNTLLSPEHDLNDSTKTGSSGVNPSEFPTAFMPGIGAVDVLQGSLTIGSRIIGSGREGRLYGVRVEGFVYGMTRSGRAKISHVWPPTNNTPQDNIASINGVLGDLPLHPGKHQHNNPSSSQQASNNTTRSQQQQQQQQQQLQQPHMAPHHHIPSTSTSLLIPPPPPIQLSSLPQHTNNNPDAHPWYSSPLPPPGQGSAVPPPPPGHRSHEYHPPTNTRTHQHQQPPQQPIRQSSDMTSHPPLDVVLNGDLNDMQANLGQARQFNHSNLTEGRLVELIVSILKTRGSVPIGRMGSLLHETTNNHSLPATLKELYGGLKRFIEMHSDIFVVGTDHPYNPHVFLASNPPPGMGGNNTNNPNAGYNTNNPNAGMVHPSSLVLSSSPSHSASHISSSSMHTAGSGGNNNLMSLASHPISSNPSSMVSHLGHLPGGLPPPPPGLGGALSQHINIKPSKGGGTGGIITTGGQQSMTAPGLHRPPPPPHIYPSSPSTPPLTGSAGQSSRNPSNLSPHHTSLSISAASSSQQQQHMYLASSRTTSASLSPSLKQQSNNGTTQIANDATRSPHRAASSSNTNPNNPELQQQQHNDYDLSHSIMSPGSASAVASSSLLLNPPPPPHGTMTNTQQPPGLASFDTTHIWTYPGYNPDNATPPSSSVTSPQCGDERTPITPNGSTPSTTTTHHNNNSTRDPTYSNIPSNTNTPGPHSLFNPHLYTPSNDLSVLTGQTSTAGQLSNHTNNNNNNPNMYMNNNLGLGLGGTNTATSTSTILAQHHSSHHNNPAFGLNNSVFFPNSGLSSLGIPPHNLFTSQTNLFSDPSLTASPYTHHVGHHPGLPHHHLGTLTGLGTVHSTLQTSGNPYISDLSSLSNQNTNSVIGGGGNGSNSHGGINTSFMNEQQLYLHNTGATASTVSIAGLPPPPPQGLGGSPHPLNQIQNTTTPNNNNNNMTSSSSLNQSQHPCSLSTQTGQLQSTNMHVHTNGLDFSHYPF